VTLRGRYLRRSCVAFTPKTQGFVVPILLLTARAWNLYLGQKLGRRFDVSDHHLDDLGVKLCAVVFSTSLLLTSLKSSCSSQIFRSSSSKF
jgi:hypothetical protein